MSVSGNMFLTTRKMCECSGSCKSKVIFQQNFRRYQVVCLELHTMPLFSWQPECVSEDLQINNLMARMQE